jgi:hypothetical protein
MLYFSLDPNHESIIRNSGSRRILMIAQNSYIIRVVLTSPLTYQTLVRNVHYLLEEAQLNPSIHPRNPMLLQIEVAPLPQMF